MSRPLAVALAFQVAETPPFTSWAQLVVFLIAVGMVVNWLWKFIREKRNGPPSGVAREAIQHTELLKRLEKVTDLQGVTLTGLTGSVAALNLTATVLGERLANMATKLDLQQAAESNRHALRNAMGDFQAVILEAIRENKP